MVLYVHMTADNPKIVVDAVLDEEKTFGKIKLQQITVYKYCLLERLNSPFINPDGEFTIDSIAPTVFVLSKSRDELKEYVGDLDKLKEAALDFLDDNLTVSDVPEIMKTVVKMFVDLNKAAPQSDAEKKSE